MYVFAIKWSDKTLIEFGDDGMRSAVRLMLDSLDLLYSHSQVLRIFKNTAQHLGAFGQVA